MQLMPNLLSRTWGAALAATLAAALAAAPAHASHSRSPCHAAAARTEAALGIPAHLLSAIALAESGRWDRKRKETIAWPWTIYAEGRARYAPSKARAVVEVKRLRARGVRNIDVGCMQVNLHYHPDAFRSLSEAFDPAANVAYAGGFLKTAQEHRAVVDPVDRPLPLAAAQAQQALPYPRAAIVDGRAAPGDAGAPRRAGRILPAGQGRHRRGAKPVLLRDGAIRQAIGGRPTAVATRA